MSDDSEEVNAAHSPENNANVEDSQKLDASTKDRLVVATNARSEVENDVNLDTIPYNSDRSGRGIINALSNEYENKILPDWRRYVTNFSQRAGGVAKVSSERLESIRQSTSAAEGEIRSRCKRTAPNTENSTHPITFFETLKLPRFREHWWKVGLGTLILVWIIVNFDFAIICSLGGIAGFAFWLQKQQHDNVDSGRNALTQELELYELEQRTAAEERAKLVISKEKQLAEHNLKCTDEKAPLSAEWAKSCSDYNVKIWRLYTLQTR